MSKALLGAGVVGASLWFSGFPAWAAATVGAAGFLALGGLQYTRLMYRNLPNELRYFMIVLSFLRDTKKACKRNLYISDFFKETVERYPNKIAIIFEDRRITFRELDEMSNRIANSLRAAGLRRGDTAAMFMENCPEYIAVLLGLSKLGVTGAFIKYYLRYDVLIHCIKISNCSAVVFSSSLAEALSGVLPDLDPTISDMCYSVGGDAPSIPQSKSLEAEMKKSSPNDPPTVKGKSVNDLICYIFTSGTTDVPKACPMKHSGFYALQSAIKGVAQITPNDVVYDPLQLDHTNGGVMAVGQMLVTGTTLVIREKFSASQFWTDCVEHKCTFFIYYGELLRYVLAQPSRPTDTQHCIQRCLGNGLKYHIWGPFVKRFKIPQIIECYGATESNVAVANLFNKVGACGKAFVALPLLSPIALIKIHPDTGEYLRDSNGFCVKAGVGEPGEIIGKFEKKNPFPGYTDPIATKKKMMSNVFKQGDCYQLTGDILKMDEDGFLYFCDRTGDTFRWKGENVSTTEVESVIGHILELRDVVVYGVEVAGSEGRAGMAAIVGTESTVDLSGLAQQLFLSLPAYSVPLFVRLIKKADLTGTYKLKKVQLRNEAYNLSKVSDPLFILNASKKTYEPFTEEKYQQLESGALRV